MEKIFKLSKLNKYPINYNIDAISTPIKLNPNKYKETFINNFLQEIQNQNKVKNKTSIPFNSKKKIQETNTIEYNQVIERKGKYSNIHSNKNTISNQRNTKNNNIKNNYSENFQFSLQKTNNKNNKNATAKYKILNPFKERSSSSSKSILIPTNENQISIFKKTEILSIGNNSVISEFSDNAKKYKRNNTVYVKKHLSKEKNYKNNYNRNSLKSYKNKDEKYNKINKKNIPRVNSTTTISKKEYAGSNTPNVNSNVNIFNFDMNYNNAPNYFIKNSKMFNPYFNDYLPNNYRKENNFNNIRSIKNQNLKNSFKESYNNSFIKMENFEEFHKNKMEKQIFEQSAIIIQSVYRGCIIRFQINNLLKAYKAVDVLSHFFKCFFWKFFVNNINMKSNTFNNEIDSKMSISSISCISALLNSNNKNMRLKTFNSKLFKEVHEFFFILNSSPNYNNNAKYLETFNEINTNNKNKIWNKKKIPRKASSKVLKSNKKEASQSSVKIKSLKVIVVKYLNNSKIKLLKYFMKFHFNGILYKKKHLNFKDDLVIKHKLIKIIENKEIKNKNILHIYIKAFNFRGLLNFMENHWYFMNNGGRLQDISQNTFFNNEPKIFENGSHILNQNNENRNIGIILKKIKILKKITFKKRKLTKERIRQYFYKFHFYGIIFYMQKELTKRIISKKLLIFDDKNKNQVLRDEQIINKKKILLRKLIINKNKDCNNVCKNLFDKWNLRTKIFSMIAIDKEKKKKRRIKKRNNKKLSSNNSNIPNNNINSSSNNFNIINKKNNNILSKTNYPINLKKDTKNTTKQKYFIEHSNSVILSNKIKISDYYKLNNFIKRINAVLTKQFYFYNLILKNYNDKKTNEKTEEKNKVNDDIDFFIEDSSENSEDN